MLVKGNKLRTTKRMASFLDEGDIVEVIDVDENDMISFVSVQKAVRGVMSLSEIEKYFEKVTNNVAPTVTSERVNQIMENSTFAIHTVFNKCTVVACQLPNGFVIVESSACVDPENYDEEVGAGICLDKIKNKVWELEGYLLQNKLYEENDCPYGCFDCDECPCDEECDDCERDECLDTDLDCDDCDDHDCIYNPNR